MKSSNYFFLYYLEIMQPKSLVIGRNDVYLSSLIEYLETLIPEIFVLIGDKVSFKKYFVIRSIKINSSRFYYQN